MRKIFTRFRAWLFCEREADALKRELELFIRQSDDDISAAKRAADIAKGVAEKMFSEVVSLHNRVKKLERYSEADRALYGCALSKQGLKDE